jgi:hypothetical protein
MRTIIGFLLHTIIFIVTIPICLGLSVVKFNLRLVRDAYFQYHRHWVMVKEIIMGTNPQSYYAPPK